MRMSTNLLEMIALGLLGSAALGSPANAVNPGLSPPVRSSPLELGVSHVITSKVLDENRIVNVILPSSYRASTARRYPVLYVIDGGLQQDLLHVAGAVWLGAMWGRSEEAMVVGIETKDRRKELVGPTTDVELLKRYPTAGSSVKFRQYIRDEVKPLVERLYRTSGRNVVLGESLAGLFIVETYLTDPVLFDAYGAVDPSLWWDKGALSNGAVTRMGDAQKGRALLIAAAKEQLSDAGAYNRLLSSIRGAGASPCVIPRPDQTHGTIYQQLTPAVLQYLLPTKEMPPLEFGFVVTCSEH
jgi:hypothetical protein